MKNINLLLKTVRKLKKTKKKTKVKNRFALGLFGVLGVGGILIVLFVIYSVWSSMNSIGVAELLPSDKTLAYIEVEDFVLPSKLKNSLSTESALFTQNVLGGFGVEDVNTLPSWTKKNVGITWLKQGLGANRPVFFFRSVSRKKAWSYFNDLTLDGEEIQQVSPSKYPIFRYPQGQRLAFMFAGPYLFVAQNAKDLEDIQAVQEGKLTRLSEKGSYVKAFSNLPKNVWTRGYIDMVSLLPGDGQQASALLSPLKQFTNELSWTIRKKQNGFHFNTFIGLSDELLAAIDIPVKSSPFTYGLSEFIHAEDLALYIGGADLGTEWQNSLETVNQLNPAYGLILEGIVRAQVKNIFGNDVSLEDDIYPLFKGEYALTFAPGSDEDLGLQLILTHSDRATAAAKLEKLAEGFSLLAAQFTPEIRVIVLPDGTEAKELVADPDALTEVQEKYKEYDINCIEVRNSIYGFCYAITDQLIVLGNNLDGVKATIDAGHSSQYVLSQYQPFRRTLSPLSKVSDEMTFINFANITPLLQKHPAAALASPYLEPFDAVTWVKHYFDDGVSSEGFVLLK